MLLSPSRVGILYAERHQMQTCVRRTKQTPSKVENTISQWYHIQITKNYNTQPKRFRTFQTNETRYFVQTRQMSRGVIRLMLVIAVTILDDFDAIVASGL
jgi:hypothetical protein